MIKAIVSDFSRVLLFPKDKTYLGSLNALHKEFSPHVGYNPLDYFELNTELLNLYATLKDTTPIYVFTSDTIQDAPEFQPFLQPVFTEIMSAKKMSIDKKTTEAYTAIAQHLNLQPNEILYTDDSEENIAAAKTAGFATILYTDFESLSQEIKKALAS